MTKSERMALKVSFTIFVNTMQFFWMEQVREAYNIPVPFRTKVHPKELLIRQRLRIMTRNNQIGISDIHGSYKQYYLTAGVIPHK